MRVVKEINRFLEIGNRMANLGGTLEPPKRTSQVRGRSLSARTTCRVCLRRACVRSESRLHLHHHIDPARPCSMASDDAKENIADGLGAGLSFKLPSAPSPKKSRKGKTRSKSIGPSGLPALEEKPSALKESHGNRRKVCANMRATVCDGY